jgi:putative acetyltransferase
MEMGDLVDIREEHTRDSAAIHSVNTRAFGRSQEADLVDTLRRNDGVLLSLVATLDGRVLAYLLYSPVTVGVGDAGVTGAGLGPMAVLPEYQRRGIGRRLIEFGNLRLKKTGCPFIVVLGHPAYYPRFGFTPANRRGIECEWDVPDDAFMVLILDKATMKGVFGSARYRTEFSTFA